MWTGVHDAVPAQSMGDCKLLSMPPALLEQTWPAERGIAGLRVCKQLRRDLMIHCSSFILVQKAGTMPTESWVAEDLKRLPHHHLKVKWKTHGAATLLGVLGDCKALVHLDLSSTGLGGDGVCRLARVLGGCKALAHLNLSENGI
eukprot:2883749-Rhodomonas_salina.1